MARTGKASAPTFAHIKELRAAILRWVYQMRVTEVRRPSVLAQFLKSPHCARLGWKPQDRQVREAWEDLRTWGLVKEWGILVFSGADGIQYPHITAAGKICVEQWNADIAAYQAAGGSPREALESSDVRLTLPEIGLLEYVYDKAGRDTREPVDLPPAGDGQIDALRDTASLLVQNGLLKFASFAGDVTITTLGVATVDDLRAQRDDWPTRTATLRRALIDWLYKHYVQGASPSMTQDFLTSDLAYYAGQPYNVNEIIQALIYLRAKGLLDGYEVDQSPHLIQPSLTDRGIDCAESGKPVAEFLNPQAAPGATSYHVYAPNAQGLLVGQQQNFTQNNTTGFDPTQVLHFAGLARQSAPALGLDAEQQATVERDAEALHAEASSAAPSPSRMRQLMDSVMASLTTASTSVLGQMVIEAGQHASTAIGALM